MALADVPGSWRRPPGGRNAGRGLSLGAVPPPAMVLLGVVSVQVGAGLAKHLFDRMPPDAVVLLRLLTSALVLCLVARKALPNVLRVRDRRDLSVAAGFGLTLALMNFSIYQSFSRIPLGIAVTIEFMGPLTVSILASRRPRDLVWAALACCGVVLLARGGGHVNAAGIGFALLAAVAWAGYILLSASTGRRFAGSTGLALASVVGAAVMLPLGIAEGGSALLRPELLLVAAGVGLLSSVIPYTLELEALRRMPARLFGILMSLEPAVAALVGVLVLGEVLAGRQWVAIGCVIMACVGATYTPQDPKS